MSPSGRMCRVTVSPTVPKLTVWVLTSVLKLLWPLSADLWTWMQKDGFQDAVLPAWASCIQKETPPGPRT